MRASGHLIRDFECNQDVSTVPRPALQSCVMRIISVRPGPVARLFAIIYAVCGLSAFVVWAFTGLQTYYLPLGFVMGLFRVSVNLQFGRSSDLLNNALLCAGSIVSYALTGWITGIVLTLAFNFLAQKTGGIDARFVSARNSESSSPTSGESLTVAKNAGVDE
jgi:hypothetical protein